MTLPLVKPAGWDDEDLLTSDAMNQLQALLVRAIDGQEGGIYELTEPLVLNGAIVEIRDLNIPGAGSLSVNGSAEFSSATQFLGPVDLFDKVDLETGANVNLKSGAELNVQGTGKIDVEAGANINVFGFCRVKPGGAIDVEIGAALGLSGTASVFGTLNVKSGGEIEVENGGAINLQGAGGGGKMTVAGAGAIELAAPSQLKIMDAAFGGYHNMVPLSRVQGEWDPSPNAAGLWLDNAANGTASIRFALTLQPGDTLTSVVVNFEGQSGVTGHAGLPSVMPLVTLVEVDFDGNSTQIAQTTDSQPNVAAYDAPHLITLSGGLLPRLAGGGKRLVLVVRCEGGTNASAGKSQIIGIGITGIARVIRNTTLHL